MPRGLSENKMKLESFDGVISAMKANASRDFHLLMGNGFSMAYDPEIFSYNALHDFVAKSEDKELSRLFEVFKTKNFELIMQQLDQFAILIDAFKGDAGLKLKIEHASKKLKESLLDAVNGLHPEHVFTVPQEKNDACAKFLNSFVSRSGSIFTTNYDLLLYWVLMRNGIMKSIDGFGRDRESQDEYVPPEDLEYSELRWGKYKDGQNVFYVHGALPLFDTGVEIVKEEYDSQHYLLQNISERIDRGEYPIFVTAGNGREKLTHIMHNRYLSHAYEALSKITGSLVTFGFNFGEYDEHIIDAINTAAKHGRKQFPKLLSVYIGVYSDGDRAHIENIAGKFKCKVHIYDASTAGVWG